MSQSSEIGHLYHVSKELVTLLDRGADSLLPQEIVDVVKLHSKLGTASALIPVSGLDMAAAAASIWGMYIRINQKIGLPFGKNILQSVASGVVTNLASYVAITGVASALKWIPGLGTIAGSAVLLAANYALIIASGYVYLKALTLIAKRNGGAIYEGEIGRAINEVMKDKATIQNLINEAKNNYRK